MKDFWGPLIALLDDLDGRGMIRGDWHEQIGVANTLEELCEKLKG
jgi:hypothetical protein